MNMLPGRIIVADFQLLRWKTYLPGRPKGPEWLHKKEYLSASPVRGNRTWTGE